MFTLGLLIGCVMVAIAVSSWVFVKIEEGEVGVLTRFGRALRKPDGSVLTLHSGLHRKEPWDRILRVSLKEQSLDLSGEEHRDAMTSDGIVVRYDSALRFVPVESEIENYLFSLERPTAHIVGTFTCLLRNEIANFGSRGAPLAAMDDLTQTLPAQQLIEASLGAYAEVRRERGVLQARLSDYCQRVIGARLGVRFDAIDVMNFEPPEELRDTLHTVIQAKTDAEAALYRAQGESQQRLLSARRGVEIAEQRAKAVETEMVVLGQKLKQLHDAGVLEDYVARRRAEVLAESKHVYVRGAVEAPRAAQGGA